MTRLTTLRALVVTSLVFGAWALRPQAQSSASAGNRRRVVPAHTPQPPRPATTQRIFAPLPAGAWTDAEVILNNNSPSDMTVTPTVYRDGVGLHGSTVTLKPAEVRWVKLSELSKATGRQVTTNDGMELVSTGHVLELGAQVILVRSKRAGSVDVPFSGAAEYRSSVQEAVWSLPTGAQSVVALGNASDVTVYATIQQSAQAAEEIEIPAHVTRTIRSGPAPRNAGLTAGWMHIDVRGPRASVRATGFVEANGRFVGGIRFYDPATIRQSDLFAANLRVRDAVPALALKNTSDAPITVIPQFHSADQAASPFDLPTVTIPAHTAMTVDLQLLQDAAAVRDELAHVSVHVVNSGAPGTLIGGLSAVSRDGARGYDVPLRDSGPSGHATGSYPWRIDGDSSTVVSLTNVSGSPAKYHARIIYPGGVYWLPEEALAVDATATIDLRELRDDNVPDRDGNTLPASLTGGQFRWSSVDARGETQLAGRAEIISATAGRSSSYSCFVCCGDSVNYGLLSPGQWSVPVSLTADTSTLSHFYDCYGNDAGSWDATAASWWVQYSGVTSAWTVANGTGRTSGNDGGTSNLDGYWMVTENYQDPNDWESCASDSFEVDAPGDVKVQLPRGLSVAFQYYVYYAPGNYRWRRTYQVLDQFGEPLRKANQAMTESWPFMAGNCIDPNTFQTSGAFTDTNGRFDDDYWLAGPPNPCTTNGTQHHSIDGQEVSTYFVTWTYTGVTF